VGQRDPDGLVRRRRGRRPLEGKLYFSLHQHGVNATGRWVGLSYDGPLVTGWSSLARTEEEVVALMDQLRNEGKASTR
jgi:hypothetical protein